MLTGSANLQLVFYDRAHKNTTHQASPKFMAPRHKGLTRTPAVGDSSR